MNIKAVSFEGGFGWLHQTTGGPLGVVLCASWDYEALATHPSWRVLADRLAGAGLPTLRFDYPGSGDSLGESAAPGWRDQAVASIGRAAAFLKANAGVERIALVGHRLGAALALQAAREIDVEAAVLIRPVVRGKSYLAEQRALARIICAREGAQVAREPEPGGVEIEGFRLSAETVDEIRDIDLAKADFVAPRRALIAAEPGSRQYSALRDRLVALGSIVSQIDLAEVAAWGAAPVPPPPPLFDADAIAAWLAEGTLKRMARPAPETSGLQTTIFKETAIAFGAEESLRGLLCRPQRGALNGEPRVVVFLSTGANAHIGSGRSFVDHARALAEGGVASLRMDSLGIGDSPWLPEGPLGAIHRVERVADVSAAIDWLRRGGFGEITLVGVCSGAFLAFQTALADARVKRLLLANPSFWTPPSLETLADPLAGSFGSTWGYVAKLFNPLMWRRLAAGEVQLASIARALLQRQSRKLVQSLESVFAQQRARRRGSLIARLEWLEHRGCQTRLLLSEGDSAHETLAAELPGRDLSAVDGLMSVVEVPAADHAFALPRTRRQFRAELARLMDGKGAAEAGVGRRRRAA